MSISFEHNNNHWEVDLDRDFDIKRAYLNGRKVKITKLREKIIWDYICKNWEFQPETI